MSRNYLKYRVPHFNLCITPSEPETFKLLYNKFDEVAHLTLGHNNIVNEFMGAMDAIRVKAEAASMKNLQIGRVQLPGRGGYIEEERKRYLRHKPERMGWVKVSHPIGSSM